MRYEKDILLLLSEAGEKGLLVRKISCHIFNTYNSFFLPLDAEDVHREVKQSLIKISKRPNSTIGKMSKGIYCINLESHQLNQMRLEFLDEQYNNKEISPQAVLSLNLFD